MLLVGVVLVPGFGFFPQGLLRRPLERMLQAATSDQSSLGNVHVVPLLLQGSVSDLRIEMPGIRLVVPHGEVQVSPRAFSAGALYLRSLTLDSPRLELRPAPASKAASPGPGPSALPPVRVDRVDVTHASLEWSDSPTGRLTVASVSARGSVGVGALDVEAPEARWTGETTVALGPARAQIAVTPLLDATLERLDVQLDRTRLSARGQILRRGAPSLGLDVQGGLDVAGLARAAGSPGAEGALSLDARVDGTPDALRARAAVHGNLAWDGWRARALNARGTWNGAARSADLHVSASVLGGSLEADAALAGGRSRGNVRLSGVRLDQVPASFRAGLDRGRAEAAFSWDGPLDGAVRVRGSVQGEGEAAAGHGRLRGEARGSVSVASHTADLDWRAHLDAEASTSGSPAARLDAHGTARGPLPPRVDGTLGGEASFTSDGSRVRSDVAGSFSVHGTLVRAALDARGAAGSLHVDGEVSGEQIRTLSARATALHLAPLASGAAGTLDARATASGPLVHPSVHASVTGRGLAWQGVRLGALEARASGDLRDLSVHARLPDLAVEADETLALADEPRVRGEVRFQSTPLAPFAPLAPPDAGLGGTVTASLRHDVPVDAPARGEATLDVSALEVAYSGRTVRAQPFTATLREGRLSGQGLHLEGGGAHLQATFDVPLHAEDALDVEATVSADLAALPAPAEWSLGGSVGASLHARGSRAQPRVDGELRLSDVTAQRPGMPAIEIDAARLPFTDEGLDVPAVPLRVGNGTATLDGRVPWPAAVAALRRDGLQPRDEASLSLRWDDVEIEALGGATSGSLTVEGGLAALDEPTVVLTLPRTALRVEGVAVTVEPTTLRIEKGRASTTDLRVGTGGGQLDVEGGADLAAGTVDARARGDLALAVLSPLLPEAAVSGSASLDLSVTGPLADPRPAGTLGVKGGSIRLRTLPQAVTALDGTLRFTKDAASVDASGRLGGGTLQVTGEAQLHAGVPSDLWLQLTGREVALRYPEGLRSRLDVDLTLAGQPGSFTLAGDVSVERGVYEIEQALGAALQTSAPASGESAMLRDVALDVRVKLARAVLVRSSFGDLEAIGQITARGDLQQPAPFGRLTVRKGGKLEIQGRQFTVTDGSLTYSGDWNANLVLRGEAVISDVEDYADYTVRIGLEGSMDSPSVSLSADPPLSRQEIASLIATGRLHSTLVDTSAWLLGGQAATLVSGQLTRKVARTFGLDQITVRPDLVAGETDPSARFTFGKRFGPRLGVIYSVGLGGPETRFVEALGTPGYDVALRGQRRDSGEYSLGAGQQFDWGAAEPARRGAEQGVQLDDVRIESEEPLPEGARDSVRLGSGRRVRDWQVQAAGERLRDRLRREGHLDAEVTAHLDGHVAVLSVTPGPIYGWRVEGVADPPDLDPVMDEALFEADALDLGRRRLLRVLRGRGYLRAEVSAHAEDGGAGRRVLVFEATPGKRFDDVDVRFPGAEAIPRSVLLDAAGGASGLLERPDAARSALSDLYRQRHFLETTVAEPRIDESPSGVRVVVDVDEGPPARLASLELQGSTLPDADLRKAARLEPGEVYADDAVSGAIVRIRGLYLSHGYTDVRIRPHLAARGHDLVLTLQIEEGDAHEIREIVLDGNDRTRDSLVRRAMDLKIGDPLDPRRLADAERRLLNLGVFSRAAIVPQSSDPSSLRVELEEAANLGAGYDLRWDGDVGAGALVNGEARNILGLGLAVGGRYRYGRDYKEVRGTFFLPAALTGGDVTASVFRTEEDISTEEFDIVQIQKGFQVQQSLRLTRGLDLLAGYRFRRNTTIAPILEGEPIDVGGLDLSLIHETRDDLLDPLEGSFVSLNFEIAPSFLGSDAPLLKWYGQVSLAHSFAGETFTWAQSYRLGLGTGFGEPLLPAERFKAGGANSLRGFATNAVGPRGPLGDPAGGAAVAIVNQELRYRWRWGVGGVVFYDGGNVFATVSDLGFDWRHTLGLGLRWASPVGLLRFDVGFPLDRQPEEKSYRMFFSIGQAF